MATMHDVYSLMPDRVLPRVTTFADALRDGKYVAASPTTFGADGGPTARGALQLEATVLRAFVEDDDVLDAVRNAFEDRFTDIKQRIETWAEVDPEVQQKFERMEQELLEEKNAHGISTDKLQLAQQEIAFLENGNKLQGDELQNCFQRLDVAQEDIKRLERERDAAQLLLQAEKDTAKQLSDEDIRQRQQQLQNQQAEEARRAANVRAAPELNHYQEERADRDALREEMMKKARKTAEDILAQNDGVGEATRARTAFSSASQELRTRATALRDEADLRVHDPDGEKTRGLREEADAFDAAADAMDSESKKVEQRAAAVPPTHPRRTAFETFWHNLLTLKKGQPKLAAAKDKLWPPERFFEFAAFFDAKQGKSFNTAASAATKEWNSYLAIRTQDLEGHEGRFPANPQPKVGDVSAAVDKIVRELDADVLGTPKNENLDALMTINLALERIFLDGERKIDAAGGWFTEQTWKIVDAMSKRAARKRESREK